MLKISLFALCVFGLSFGTAVFASTYNVSITSNSYNPSTIQINAGDTVIWTNTDILMHTVTSDNGTNELSSQILYSGNTYSHTFSNQGTFSYHCTYNSNIHGTVTVGYNNNYNNQQNGNYSVQTNYATNISNNSVTLNGTLSSNNSSNYNGTTYAWFQWGTDTNYGNTTFQQTLNYGGQFTQALGNLSPNTTYHFRAVAQINGSTVYGQDMTFIASGSGYGNTQLQVTKAVINLSTGNLNWQNSVSANQGDILSFAVTLQASQNINNVYLRDILPSGLIYKGNVIVNTNTNFGGDITAGINIGTVYANQPVVVSYQAQVVNAGNYGNSAITDTTTVTSNEAGSQTASATILVNNSAVIGANTYNPGPTYISTGMTNNFFTDSFFLPLLMLLLSAYFYFSGKAYKFADWVKSKI